MRNLPAANPRFALSAHDSRSNFKQDMPLTPLAVSCAPVDKIFRVQSSLNQALWSALALATLFTLSPGESLAVPPPKLPELKVVLDYVDRHFANTTDFKPGDIISTSNVTPLFDGLDLIGWNVPDRKAILDKVPSDNDYVVKQLRTDAGRKFMQQMGNLPLGYDRLFRLGRLALGRQQVKDLIHTKDGYQMIEYMTNTQQGKNLGTQLSHAQGGTDFNQPTGQIYTVAALKAELEKSYEKTLQARAKAAK